MSETLAPGKQKVTTSLDLIFLMMESPIIIVDGGGGTEASLDTSGGRVAAAAAGCSEGVTVDSGAELLDFTRGTGPVEPLLDTASLRSLRREDADETWIFGCSPSGGKSSMSRIWNLLDSGISRGGGEGGGDGRTARHLFLRVAIQPTG